MLSGFFGSNPKPPRPPEPMSLITDSPREDVAERTEWLVKQGYGRRVAEVIAEHTEIRCVEAGDLLTSIHKTIKSDHPLEAWETAELLAVRILGVEFDRLPSTPT